MAETTAEQKRALLPFLQRAEEIQKADPRVAYYCRMYAVEEAPDTTEVNAARSRQQCEAN